MKQKIKQHLPPGLLSIIRPLARSVRLAKSRLRTQRVLRAIRTDPNDVHIELGPGSHPIGTPWIGIDNNASADITWDLRTPLPFVAESVKGIYSSHVLEHFTPFEVLDLLKECVRVLRPDGFLLAAVPHAGRYIRSLTDTKAYEDLKSHTNGGQYCVTGTPMDLVNMTAYMYGQHMCMFDEKYLCGLLEKAGFSHSSTRPFLKGYDLEVRDWESLYVFAGFRDLQQCEEAIRIAMPNA